MGNAKARTCSIESCGQQQDCFAAGKCQQQRRRDGQKQARDKHDVRAVFISQSPSHKTGQDQRNRINREKQTECWKSAILAVQGQESHDRAH